MKIFYSWQSDIENSHNRGFIQKAIESAIKKLNRSVLVDEPERNQVQLDHDTKGVPGTPDLANTIFDKISTSEIFIADVSLVGHSNNECKKLPNPNVMIELGYALSVLGSDRVICVFNEAYGSTKELPFDLKHRRHPIKYHFNNGNAKVPRDKLAGSLKSAVELILGTHQFSTKGVLLSSNPSFSEIIDTIMATDSVDDWRWHEHDHKQTFFFKKNVNLRLEIDYSDSGIHQESFKEDWATRHPDNFAASYWCNLYYNSTLVDRFILVSVDGGRTTLPLPELVDLSVERLDYKIAKICDADGRIDEYMKRSGLRLKQEINGDT